jgi:hypothetical protein
VLVRREVKEKVQIKFSDHLKLFNLLWEIERSLLHNPIIGLINNRKLVSGEIDIKTKNLHLEMILI